jgi:hypothetical protein
VDKYYFKRIEELSSVIAITESCKIQSEVALFQTHGLKVLNGRLIIDDIDRAAAAIVVLSYGDRAGASMLFDVCMNGKKKIQDTSLGGSNIWCVRHRLDKSQWNPRKKWRTKRSIARHLADAGMVEFDGEVISPRIREIVFHLSGGTKVRTIGPSLKEIHDFLRSVIPKAVAPKKLSKARVYLKTRQRQHHYDIRIKLPRPRLRTTWENRNQSDTKKET